MSFLKIDDLEKIIELHHVEQLKLHEIAKLYNVKKCTVQRFLKRHSIKIINWTLPQGLILPTKDELEKLYVQDMLSMSDIAKRFNTSVPTIRKKLKAYDIPQRNRSSDQSIAYSKIIEHNRALHGVDYLFQLDEFKQTASQTKIEKYGTPYPQFSNTSSKAENEIRTFLETSTKKKFSNNFDVLSGKELDMYNPELGIAIEYCGLYFHHENSPSPKNRTYHYNKWKKCKEKNIQLFTIFEDEWLYREFQIKNHLKSLLCNIKTVYARHTYVERVSPEIAQIFCEANHIQGKTSNNIKYAFAIFIHASELLGVMTFSSHHRKNDDDGTLVLSRMCFKNDTRIVGGASKLFKYALKTISENHSVIVSWSDNRWSNGNVYEKMGFKKTKELGPDYSYVHGKHDKRFSKQSMRKSKIHASDNQTEHERAMELGYSRIWDCGKIRWEYTR